MSDYKEAVILECNFGGAATNICCLGHYALTDDRFSKLMNGHHRLRHAFELMTGKDTGSGDNEPDEIAMIFVEFALLNRARFACGQKFNFHRYYKYVEEDEETKLDIVDFLDKDLKYVEGLLAKCNTEQATKMKGQVSRWLATVPGQGNNHGEPVMGEKEFDDNDEDDDDDDDGGEDDDDDDYDMRSEEDSNGGEDPILILPDD